METLLDKTEKSLTKDLPLPAAEPLALELGEQEGLRIVKQALAREVWRLASKVGFFLFVFGGLAYIGLWCFNQVRNIPVNFAKPVYHIDLPQTQKESAATLEASKGSLEGAKKSEVKASSTIAKEHTKARRMARVRTKLGKKAVARRKSTGIYPGQQPAGGRITYQDGNITEYHWR
jgi:hypothetical protein